MAKTTGEKLKELRVAKKLSQREIAEMLKKTTGFISHVELNRHNFSVPDLIKIAKFYGVSLDYLTSDDQVDGGVIES